MDESQQRPTYDAGRSARCSLEAHARARRSRDGVLLLAARLSRKHAPRGPRCRFGQPNPGFALRRQPRRRSNGASNSAPARFSSRFASSVLSWGCPATPGQDWTPLESLQRARFMRQPRVKPAPRIPAMPLGNCEGARRSGLDPKLWCRRAFAGAGERRKAQRSLSQVPGGPAWRGAPPQASRERVLRSRPQTERACTVVFDAPANPRPQRVRLKS
jgi:hypothetical protein